MYIAYMTCTIRDVQYDLATSLLNAPVACTIIAAIVLSNCLFTNHSVQLQPMHGMACLQITCANTCHSILCATQSFN